MTRSRLMAGVIELRPLQGSPSRLANHIAVLECSLPAASLHMALKRGVPVEVRPVSVAPFAGETESVLLCQGNLLLTETPSGTWLAAMDD